MAMPHWCCSVAGQSPGSALGSGLLKWDQHYYSVRRESAKQIKQVCCRAKVRIFLTLRQRLHSTDLVAESIRAEASGNAGSVLAHRHFHAVKVIRAALCKSCGLFFFLQLCKEIADLFQGDEEQSTGPGMRLREDDDAQGIPETGKMTCCDSLRLCLVPWLLRRKAAILGWDRHHRCLFQSAGRRCALHSPSAHAPSALGPVPGAR